MNALVSPPSASAARGRTPRRSVALPATVLIATGIAILSVRVAVLGADNALPSALRDGLTLAASVIIESLPFVFLGILLSIAVRLWVPDRVIDALLPRRAVARRAVLSLLGVALPVCECGNVPLARGLMLRGFSLADAVTFLLAAPILNPITIVTTYQAFGWQDGILIARVGGGFLVANLVGWLVSLHPSPQSLITPAWSAACAAPHGEQAGSRGARAIAMFRAEIGSMVPALFVGAAVAGLIQVAVSREVLVAIGGHPVYGILALMALAFVVAICSNVDAFFALSLASAFSPGALVAFLVFGPLIDVKIIAMLATTFRARLLTALTLVVALATFVLGLAVNALG